MRAGLISTVVVPLLSAVLGGGIGSLLTYWNTNREIDVKMIEIAVGILAREPESAIAPAREWAVDVISHYAEVKPSDAVRSALIENRAVFVAGGSDDNTSFSNVGNPGITGGALAEPGDN